MAIEGEGFFMVQDGRGERRLTRDGQMGRNDRGELVLLSNPDHRVLDVRGRRITMLAKNTVNVAENGNLMQKGRVVGRIGVYRVADPQSLSKEGDSLWSGDLRTARTTNDALIRGRYIEGSNVEVSMELAALINTQRQLEANANMIRFQDQTLSRLVNDVGKIG
jgi:flagellar basal body rod protein FlgG